MSLDDIPDYSGFYSTISCNSFLPPLRWLLILASPSCVFHHPSFLLSALPYFPSSWVFLHAALCISGCLLLTATELRTLPLHNCFIDTRWCKASRVPQSRTSLENHMLLKPSLSLEDPHSNSRSRAPSPSKRPLHEMVPVPAKRPSRKVAEPFCSSRARA